jgi:hypothetical protein
MLYLGCIIYNPRWFTVTSFGNLPDDTFKSNLKLRVPVELSSLNQSFQILKDSLKSQCAIYHLGYLELELIRTHITNIRLIMHLS